MDGCDVQLTRKLGTSLPPDAVPRELWRIAAENAHCAASPGADVWCASAAGVSGISGNGSEVWRNANLSQAHTPLILSRQVAVAADGKQTIAIQPGSTPLWSMRGGSTFPVTTTDGGILALCSNDTLIGIVASGIPFASLQLNGTCAAMPVVNGSRLYVLQRTSEGLSLSAVDFHDSLGARVSVAWQIPLGVTELSAAPMLLKGRLLVPLSVGVKVVRDDGESCEPQEQHLPAAVELAADPRQNSVWLVESDPLQKHLLLERYDLDGHIMQRVNVSSMLSTTAVATSRLGVCFTQSDPSSIALLLGIQDSSEYALIALSVGDGKPPSVIWKQPVPHSIRGQIVFAARDPKQILPANDVLIATTSQEILAFSLASLALVV